METELIYWRHPSIPGIKIEEICGGDDKPMKLWLEMAYQIYCENGKTGYREIGHFKSGAPFLMGEPSRISISHTGRFLVVATLPPTPEINDFSHFSPRAAMGVDAERRDREQILKVRSRFLSDKELGMIAADDIETNVLAWTIKEAAYKAALTPGLDFRNDIIIEKLPSIGPATIVYSKDEFPEIIFGKAFLRINGEEHQLMLYSYISEENIITLAYSPRCAKFG